LKTTERFNNAIFLLTKFIIQRTNGIEFTIKETTTNNYEEFIKIGKPYEISLEGCSNTIYGNEYINVLARVWHDDIHYWHRLDFGFEDEYEVCIVQCRTLLLWCIENSKDKQTTLDAMQLIYEDIIGQYEYYIKHNEFVPNQYKYVYNRFKKKTENEE
jgi:hypothetical protein